MAHTPSAALAAVIGAGPFENAEIVRRLWAYIAKHDLQDPKNKRRIRLDARLAAVFGHRQSVDLRTMTALVNANLDVGATHILVGAEADLSSWEASVRSGKHVTWQVPKGARPGDRLIFYFAGLGLVGEGRARTSPRALRSRRASRFVAEAADTAAYARPVSIERVRKTLPGWGWPTYPRSYVTVPKPVLARFEELLRRHSRQLAVPRVRQKREALVTAAGRASMPVRLARSMHILAESLGSFEPVSLEDGRERTLVSLVQRQGQGRFRRQVLAAYEGRCALTGCSVEAVLEAAHLLPYRGKATNHPQNGLLLRSDLHALLDQGWLTIDARTWRVRVAEELRNSEYWKMQGRKLRLPRQSRLRPSPHALKERERLGRTWT